MVSFDSLVRGVEATQGLYAARLSLVKRKDKATHVCLERPIFYGGFRFNPDIRTDGLLPFKMASVKKIEEPGV